jgi:hypothetical protein
MGRRDLSVEEVAALFDRIKALEAALEPFAACGRAGQEGELAAACRTAAALLPQPPLGGPPADDYYFIEEGRQQDA